MARRLCPPHAARMEVVPKVTFAHLGKTVEFESGKLPYHEHGKPESILDVALNHGINLEHACGGVCACSTCHVYVDQGADLLSEASEDEEDILDKAFDVRMNSRLGCQAKLEGDGLVVVRISKESLDAYYNEHPAETRAGGSH